MSNSDTFINEVAEEVRKDRINALVRRYGWIAVVAVLAIVIVASVWEWRNAQARGGAESFGDGILAALENDDPGARVAALDDLSVEGDARALRDLIAAGELAPTDPAGAETRLRAVIEDASVSERYRALAILRLVMVPDVPVVSDERLALLEPLTAAGAPFRLSALEQMALVHVERGETAEALAALVTLRDDVETSLAMRERAAQLIVALGGLPDEA